MAQSVACMAGISGVKLEGLAAQGVSSARALNGNGSSCSSNVVVRAGRMNVVALSSQEEAVSSRRSVLSLIAATVAAGAFVKDASAVTDIKLEGPPPLSGGLPGTENADQARDTDLNLKERFFIQPLPADAAVGRLKEAAKEITNVKALIDKKAWPYVQNDLRSKAGYLAFDLRTIIDSKQKSEKKALIDLKKKLFESINALDYAARSKSTPKAEKFYAETVSILNDVIAKVA